MMSFVVTQENCQSYEAVIDQLGWRPEKGIGVVYPISLCAKYDRSYLNEWSRLSQSQGGGECDA